MKNRFALAASTAALFILILSSDKVLESSRYALTLCLNSIIPSLLPFFIVSILLNRLGLPYHLGKMLAPAARKLFSVSGAGASAFFIGITGGYPLGAAYIADCAPAGIPSPIPAAASVPASYHHLSVSIRLTGHHGIARILAQAHRLAVALIPLLPG